MRHLWILSLVILFVQQCVAPPVAEKKGEPVNEEDVDKNIEYHTYLKEVVQVLESDPEFRAKLDKVNEDDLKVKQFKKIFFRCMAHTIPTETLIRLKFQYFVI